MVRVCICIVLPQSPQPPATAPLLTTLPQPPSTMPPPQPPQGAETERPNKPQRGLATWPQPHGESAKIAGVAIATQAAIIIAKERNFMENPPRIELKLNEPVI
jgi:hypothetical protein